MNERLGNISVEDCIPPHPTQEYPDSWDRPNVGAFLDRHARDRGDLIALWDGAAEVNWTQLRRLTDAGAAALWAAGVGRGDIVVLRGGNSVELAAMMLAVMASGAVMCPVQDRSTMPEVEFILRQSGARFCLQTSSGHEAAELDEFRTMARAQADGSFGVVAIDYAAGNVGIEWAAGEPAAQEVAPDRRPWDGVGGAAPLRLLYTSGSTGAPKGVLHTHDTTMVAWEKAVEMHRWTEDSIGWIVVPFTLNWGMFQLFSSIMAGSRSMLHRRFDSAAMFAAIQDGAITHIGLPPTGYLKLLDEIPEGWTGNGVKMLVSAGAPCSPTLLERMREMFGIGLAEAFGMTEAGWISSTAPDDAVEHSSGTVGIPLPIMETRVVDETGRPCGVNEIGSVELRGPSIFVNYFKNAEQTAAAFTEDGWFITGDNGFFRADGRLTLAGREKDTLKHGGQLVIPREIEELVSTMPNVRDVAVVGVPDPYYGDRIVAVVERNDETPPVLDEVLEFVRGRLSKFKWPQEIVVVDQLPCTPTGKVQKHLLVKELGLAGQSS